MLFGSIAALLMKLGLARGAANKVAPYALGLALILAVAGGFFIWLHFHDRGVIKQHDQEREIAAGEAREEAAAERVNDTLINAQNEKDLHDAIDTAPKGGELSPAARALACERLRKLGRFPTPCRSEGGDGEQAGSR